MIWNKQVAEIRAFFDNYESSMNQMWSEMTCYERHNNLSDNMTSSKSAENLKPDQLGHGDGIAKMLYGHHFPKNQSILSSSTPNLSNSLTANTISIIGSPRLTPPLKPLRKYFYLPEEKIHSNELVKIRQHFDKSCSKQNSNGISNSGAADSAAVDENENEVCGTENHSDNILIEEADSTSAGGDFVELKGNFPSSLNESYQKISQADDSLSYEAMKNNESLDAGFNLQPLKPTTRITAQALIKSNNSMLCGGYDLKCGGNESDLVQQQDDDDDNKDIAASPSLSSSRQKHHRSKDLKPIKSLTTSEPRRNQLQHIQQQQHNLILMNDDCELLQVQDEQAPTSTSTDMGTCADKYCKNSSRAQHDESLNDKNYSKINEISPTNARINRKHNLNLDLYFDKELSAWLSKRDQQIESVTDNDNKFAITSNQAQSGRDTTNRDGDDDVLNSTGKLISETASNVTSNDDNDEDSSKSLQHFDDSFSSPSSSANSAIDTFLIDTRRQDCRCGDDESRVEKKKSQIFTDGEYFYGPYDFDLFSNEFYHFRDGNDECDECANDDEAGKVGIDTSRIISSSGNDELLKNHDEVDNNAEVSLVRDVDVVEGCETLRNSCCNKTWPNIEINVINWPDDESDFTVNEQRDDDVAFNRNFNYAPTLEACDRNLIDLMDEGDNDVSNNHRVNPYGGLQVMLPTITNTIFADDNFDAPFNPSIAELLDYSQQFNYEFGTIAEIADRNESPLESERIETCDDEKFSNDERRGFIFGDIDIDQHSFDDTKNKIRFKERDETFQPLNSPQLHPSYTECDEPDNCFSKSKIVDSDDRG